jgi:hypothetical protein
MPSNPFLRQFDRNDKVGKMEGKLELGESELDYYERRYQERVRKLKRICYKCF